MPTFPPRSETIKKEEELAKRRIALQVAIKTEMPEKRLLIIIEKYRKAQLSLLKAKLHVNREQRIKGKENNSEQKKIEELIGIWNFKSKDVIINELQNE